MWQCKPKFSYNFGVTNTTNIFTKDSYQAALEQVLTDKNGEVEVRNSLIQKKLIPLSELYINDPSTAYFDPRTHFLCLKYHLGEYLPEEQGSYALGHKVIKVTKDQTDIFYFLKDNEIRLIIVDPFFFIKTIKLQSIHGTDVTAFMTLYFLYNLVKDIQTDLLWDILPTLRKLIRIHGYREIDDFLYSYDLSLKPPFIKSEIYNLTNKYCLFCGERVEASYFFCNREHRKSFTSLRSNRNPDRQTSGSHLQVITDLNVKTLTSLEDLSLSLLEIEFNRNINIDLEDSKTESDPLKQYLFQCIQALEQIKQNFNKYIFSHSEKSSRQQSYEEVPLKLERSLEKILEEIAAYIVNQTKLETESRHISMEDIEINFDDNVEHNNQEHIEKELIDYIHAARFSFSNSEKFGELRVAYELEPLYRLLIFMQKQKGFSKELSEANFLLLEELIEQKLSSSVDNLINKN